MTQQFNKHVISRNKLFFSSFFSLNRQAFSLASTVYPVHLGFVWGTPGLGRYFRESVKPYKQINASISPLL